MEKLPPALAAQLSIRENAEAMRDALSDLGSWETTMKAKEKALHERRRAQVAPEVPQVRAGGGTVSTKSSAIKGESAARHTYDVGYQKWENFNVEAALKDIDDGHSSAPTPPTPPEFSRKALTPADLVSSNPAEIPRSSVPRPRPREERGDAAERHRQEGNALYSSGDFAGAIKCYTRAVGLDGTSVLAFSNRSQAFLKLKEWRRAETDASIAIQGDTTHAKSYLRRAVARSGQCKFRAALLDIVEAKRLVESAEGATKQSVSLRSIATEERSIRENLKQCGRRAPKVKVPLKAATPHVEVVDAPVEQSSTEGLESN